MGWCWNGLDWGGLGNMGIIGLILNLVFFIGALAVLGAAFAWLVRQFNRQSMVMAEETSPLDIARRRLASGEITIAEFEEIRDRLQS